MTRRRPRSRTSIQHDALSLPSATTLPLNVMASPALSQASTAFESDAPQNQDEQQKGQRRAALQRAKDSTTSQDIFWFLVAFRILNALSIRTFFQPDEYFQSLEPAWEISFGADSGAWITWVCRNLTRCCLETSADNISQEWKNQLRSAIHPAIFAGVYYITSELSNLLRLASEYRAELLLAAPKVTQAIFAALGDYYTWKLGGRVYGNGSNEAWIAVCRAHSVQCNILSHFALLISLFPALVVVLNRLQSMAMVRLHPHIIKLPGNDFNHHRAPPMAMALVDRCRWR